MKRWVAVAAVALLPLVGACSSSSSDDGSNGAAGKPAAKKTEKPALDKKAYAAKVEKAFSVELGDRKITDMCDAAMTHWACFYDGIEAIHEKTIRVKLTTDGGWSDSDLKDLSKRAAQHWFNFLHFDYPNIDTIVVQANGIDRNFRQSDFPALG